jgi:hypothetical protein
MSTEAEVKFPFLAVSFLFVINPQAEAGVNPASYLLIITCQFLGVHVRSGQLHYYPPIAEFISGPSCTLFTWRHAAYFRRQEYLCFIVSQTLSCKVLLSLQLIIVYDIRPPYSPDRAPDQGSTVDFCFPAWRASWKAHFADVAAIQERVTAVLR